MFTRADLSQPQTPSLLSLISTSGAVEDKSGASIFKFVFNGKHSPRKPKSEKKSHAIHLKMIKYWQWNWQTVSTQSCQCFESTSSDMGHNNLILKLTISCETLLAMSYFTFALTPWMSVQSQNSKDQSTCGSHWRGRFCGLNVDCTVHGPQSHGGRNLHRWHKSLRIWHPPLSLPLPNILTGYSFQP